MTQFPPTKMAASRAKCVKNEEAVATLGYTAIPVKFSEKHQSPHYLYVKEHKVREDRDPKRPQNRTLFVLNIPPYCTESTGRTELILSQDCDQAYCQKIDAAFQDLLRRDTQLSGGHAESLNGVLGAGVQKNMECLSRLFSSFCPVQSVEMCEKPKPGDGTETPRTKFFNIKTLLGFQIAYVVFKRPAGVQAVKSSSLQGPLIISSDSHPVQTGIHKWIARYAASIVDPAKLKTEVDSFMQTYDQKVAKEEAKAEKEEGVPDKEGWVKVTRKGRRPGLPWTEAANLRALEREKRKRARKELLNFYAWQHHETKREHIAQLRKKFEEDKQKIALMRAQRKFRPY